MHVVTSVKKGFQWGGKQQQYFEALKDNISSAPVLALPNLGQPFKIQTDASDYAMGTILLQHGKPIAFHSETFNGVVLIILHMTKNYMHWYKVTRSGNTT